MSIITRESLFEYQAKRVIEDLKKEYHLKGLNAEELQEQIWNDKELCRGLGQLFMERCNNYSGDELFE